MFLWKDIKKPPGGGGGYSSIIWMGAARVSKIGPRFRKILHSKWYPVLEIGQFLIPRSKNGDNCNSQVFLMLFLCFFDNSSSTQISYIIASFWNLKTKPWLVISLFTILLKTNWETFTFRHNAVYSDTILLPARCVGTKRALSNVLLRDNYLTIRLLHVTQDATICSLCIFFLVLVKKTFY